MKTRITLHEDGWHWFEILKPFEKWNLIAKFDTKKHANLFKKTLGEVKK